MRLENLFLESTQELQGVRGAIKQFIGKYNPDFLQNPDTHPKNLAGHIRYIGRKYERKCPTFIKELRGDFDIQGIARGTAEIDVKDLANHILSVFTAAGMVKYPNADEVFELVYEYSNYFQTPEFEVGPDQSVQVKTEQPGWYLHIADRYYPLKKAIVVKA